MKRQPHPSTGSESAAERLARAAALQAGLVGSFAQKRVERAAVASEAGEPILGPLDPPTREVLSGLDLHKRRYGLPHPTRAGLRKMGCRSLADVAEAQVRTCVNWLGYREADLVRERVCLIAARIRSGEPEPGILRMVEGLDDETRAWLLDRPVEDVAGRGIARKVAASLREAGHASLGALATEEVDEIEDIHGIGGVTVEALRRRLRDIIAEGADAPSRKRRRRMSAEDAEWDAAAPGDD